MPTEHERELAQLLRCPWSLHILRTAEGTFEATIDELPEFVAAGDTEAELTQAVWESLEALLSTYVEAGDPIPLPKAHQVARALTPPLWRPIGGVVSAA